MPFRILLLFLAIGSFAGLAFNCQSQKMVEKEKNNFSIITDTTVIWQQRYQLSIPNDFSIRSGQGEDSDFLKIINPEGDLVLDYESKMEVADKKNYSLEILQEQFSGFSTLKVNDKNTLFLAWQKNENSFRNIRGKIFLIDQNNYEEILRFSASEKRMDLLKNILQTFQITE